MHYWRHQHGSDVTHLFDQLVGGPVVELRDWIPPTFVLTDSFLADLASAGFSKDDLRFHDSAVLIFTKNEALAMWIKLKYV
jgi:hypothetical protein